MKFGPENQETGEPETNQHAYEHITIDWRTTSNESKADSKRKLGKVTVGGKNLVVTVLQHQRDPDMGPTTELLDEIRPLK